MKITGIRERIGEKKKEIFREHKVCVLTFLLLTAIWISISIFMKYTPFGKNSLLISDALHQYYPLLSQLRTRIFSGEGIGYSISGGLGYNFYTLWTYYLSSPLNIIVLLLPTVSIDALMDLLIIFKIILGGTTFAWYLERKGNKDNYTIIPFALGYALSTYVLGYNFNIMWMDCLALFPMIVAGLEELIEKGKWKLYTITLMLCLWCNFYISFMICVFVVLWFLLYQHKSILEFFKKGILFVGCSILSAGMTCVVLLPAYLGIVQASAGGSLPKFQWKASFLDVLAGDEGGIFLFSDPVAVNPINHYANLYAGVFLFGLVILYFLAKEISLVQKLKIGGLIFLFGISMDEEVMNYIWHGFHDQVGLPNRFVFLLIFVVLVVGFQAFQMIQNFEKWKIIVSGIIPLIGCSLLYYLKKDNVTTQMFISTLVFIAGYMIFELLYRSESKGKIFKRLLVFCMCAELIVNAFVGSKMQGGLKTSNYYRNPSQVQKIADLLKDELYRAELANPTVQNEGMAYGLHGTGIFSSMTNPDTIGLLHSVGFSTTSNAYNIAESTPVLNTLFGVKHYLLIANDANRLDKEYKETLQNEGVKLYTKEDVLPIAYLCKKNVENWKTLDGDFFANQNELLKLMTGTEYPVFTNTKYKLAEANDVTVEELDGEQQFSYLAPKGYRNDHVVFQCNIEEDQDLYIRIQAQSVHKVSVYINDELKAYKDLSSSFYHVGEVRKGDVITVQMGIKGDAPTYGKISMSMYAYHADVLQKAYEELNSGAMQVTEWKEGYLKGTVNVTHDKIDLFTTIPYEKGWTVRVDGKERKIETIKKGFLMVSLEKGNHEIEFVYKVPGLKTGALVSLISFLIFLGAVCIQQKRRKKKEITEEGESRQDEYEEEKSNGSQTGVQEDLVELVVSVTGRDGTKSDNDPVQSGEDHMD